MTPAAPTNGRVRRGASSANFTASRHRQGDDPHGLISLRALRGALRRRAWPVCAAALGGLAVSGFLFVKAGPAYPAETSILVTSNPNLSAPTQIQGDVTLAETLQVAARAMHKLGLHEGVLSFASSYSVTAPTDGLIQITGNAKSESEAERLANAVAAAFMQYRAELLNDGQQIEVATLNQQIAVGEENLAGIDNDIAAETGLAKSAERTKKLSALKAAQHTLYSSVGALKYTATNYPFVTLSMIKGTVVLDPAAPVPPSRRHLELMSAVAGLLTGLVLSIGVVLVEAAASDRLRRRRDIARALGAPVKLTIGRVRTASWLPGRQGLASDPTGGMPRAVAHLRSNVCGGHGLSATLAVVPVGNADVAALALVQLATSYAREGKRVLLADLANGAPAARLLKVRDPGVHVAGRERIAVAVPEPSDRVPVGPVRSPSRQVPRIRPGKALAAFYESADVLLTIATLDPMFGAEHLATWAADVVVFVTAGRSAPASLKAAGAMIRLAGLDPVSAVLVGADKADDSLGTAPVSSGSRRRRLAPGSRQSAWA